MAVTVIGSDGGHTAAVHDLALVGRARQPADALLEGRTGHRAGVVAGDDARLGAGQVIRRRHVAGQSADVGGPGHRARVAAAFDVGGAPAQGLQGAGEATHFPRVAGRHRGGIAAVQNTAPAMAHQSADGLDAARDRDLTGDVDVAHAPGQHAGHAADEVAALHIHVHVGEAQILHVVHRGEQTAASAALRGIGYVLFIGAHSQAIDAVAQAREVGAVAGHELLAVVPKRCGRRVDVRAERRVGARPLQAVGVVGAVVVGAEAGDDAVVHQAAIAAAPSLEAGVFGEVDLHARAEEIAPVRIHIQPGLPPFQHQPGRAGEAHAGVETDVPSGLQGKRVRAPGQRCVDVNRVAAGGPDRHRAARQSRQHFGLGYHRGRAGRHPGVVGLPTAVAAAAVGEKHIEGIGRADGEQRAGEQHAKAAKAANAADAAHGIPSIPGYLVRKNSRNQSGWPRQ